MLVDLVNYDKITRYDLDLKKIIKSDIEIKDHKWLVFYTGSGIVRAFYQEKFNFVYEYNSINNFYRTEFLTIEELLKCILDTWQKFI